MITNLVLLLAMLPARAQDLGRQLQAEARLNRRLNLEYTLAREGRFYLIFDLGRKQVEFRIRGVVVKSYPIVELEPRGKLPRMSLLLTLLGKKSSNPPRRPSPGIKAQASVAEPGTSSLPRHEPEMLELADMPSRFSLVFEEGLTIQVRPSDIPEGERSLGGRFRRWGFWISDGWARLKRRLGDQQPPGMNLKLSDEACRSIFWSFSDGARALMIP